MAIHFSKPGFEIVWKNTTSTRRWFRYEKVMIRLKSRPWSNISNLANSTLKIRSYLPLRILSNAYFSRIFPFELIEFFCVLSKMCWDEMCFAMPAVMKKIHNGWRTSGNSLYSGLEVKKMLDSISSQACCLSICSVSWLCSYMQVNIFRVNWMISVEIFELSSIELVISIETLKKGFVRGFSFHLPLWYFY